MKRGDLLSIGDLAKRSGVPVKTLRFWSDEGLLPPASRSPSGYRLYGEASIVRLDLVRTLREAGLDLATIQKILHRQTTLEEALALRLAAVEAHIASLQRVAATLRASLRTEPNQADLRRISAVTKLSNDERRALIERFYERVGKGIPIDEKWRAMLQASTPTLPDDPTPAQIDAWIELAEIMSDDAFVESLRTNAKEVWQQGVDVAAMQKANDEAGAMANDALARGVAADAAEAKAVVERYVEAMAAVAQRPADDAFRKGMRARFARQDPRASRYWELVAVLKGQPSAAPRVAAWRWMAQAVLHHLEEAPDGSGRFDEGGRRA